QAKDGSEDQNSHEFCYGKRKKKVISFAGDIELTTGSKRDWPYFARWHYRSHHLGFVRRVTVLWHHDEPIGICVFTTPPKSLRQRSRFFGLSGRWSKWQLQTLNAQVAMLSRVVLHPTYRGAGLAAEFIRASCRSSPWPWIETLTEMGHFHPFFEKAGFVRVGSSSPPRRSRAAHSKLYAGRASQKLVSAETHEKSRYAE